MKIKQPMKIGELARYSGFSVSTLYDYLRTGLLPNPEKQSPTKSFFTQKHMDRLEEIRWLKQQGFSMAHIRAQLVRSYNPCSEPLDSSKEIRLSIIDKTLELLSVKTYEHTRVSDITQALNIGSGTFYRYFKSKEKLFIECLERLPKVLVPQETWTEVERETDYIQRLKKRTYAMLSAFPRYFGILNYAKLALSSKDKALAKKAAECIRNLARPLENDLQRAIAEGSVRKVDARMCAYLLLGMNETLGYLLLLDPNRSVEKNFEVIEDFIIHALGIDHTIN